MNYKERIKEILIGYKIEAITGETRDRQLNDTFNAIIEEVEKEIENENI